MTVQEAYKHILVQLYEVYDQREAATIADWVTEHVTGLARSSRLVHGHQLLSEAQSTQLEQYTLQLLQHMPIQYVLHEAWFAAMKLYVDAHVLIPRPETEELVEWMVQQLRTAASVRILDIGTGSGCIPVALKKQLPQAVVSALDVSAGALAVARRNAAEQQTEIHFYEADILQEANWAALPLFDVIVSNPPYIKESEQATMHQNVLAHEPHLALFVPDQDALLFYRTIAAFAQQHLVPGGSLFFEINEALGADTVQLLAAAGFMDVELRQDMQGKDRMIRAVLPT